MLLLWPCNSIFFVHKNAREFELEGINLILDFPSGVLVVCVFFIVVV